jgi:hypothetical protein
MFSSYKHFTLFLFFVNYIFFCKNPVFVYVHRLFRIGLRNRNETFCIVKDSCLPIGPACKVSQICTMLTIAIAKNYLFTSFIYVCLMIALLIVELIWRWLQYSSLGENFEISFLNIGFNSCFRRRKHFSADTFSGISFYLSLFTI